MKTYLKMIFNISEVEINNFSGLLHPVIRILVSITYPKFYFT